MVRIKRGPAARQQHGNSRPRQLLLPGAAARQPAGKQRARHPSAPLHACSSSPAPKPHAAAPPPRLPRPQASQDDSRLQDAPPTEEEADDVGPGLDDYEPVPDDHPDAAGYAASQDGLSEDAAPPDDEEGEGEELFGDNFMRCGAGRRARAKRDRRGEATHGVLQMGQAVEQAQGPRAHQLGEPAHAHIPAAPAVCLSAAVSLSRAPRRRRPTPAALLHSDYEARSALDSYESEGLDNEATEGGYEEALAAARLAEEALDAEAAAGGRGRRRKRMPGALEGA